jgi:NAD(P) transhydrogenase subunit alpha
MSLDLLLLAAETAEGSAATADTTLPLLAAVTVFVLAIFVGFEIITKIPPTLHTPLMSGSNAISGITLVGAILAAGHGDQVLVALLGTLAVIMATINVVGGFLVTNRMLEMFRRK